MFNSGSMQQKYVPILAISPAEMNAIEELPEKDKDLIMPLFPLKGWVAAKTLDKSIKRIEKSIGNRTWIADIDSQYLLKIEQNEDGSYPREVCYELEKLMEPSNGYQNWCEFIESFDSVIPVLQLGDISQFEQQLVTLHQYNRGVVLRLTLDLISSESYLDYIAILKKCNVQNVLIIFDFGQISVLEVDEENIDEISKIISLSSKELPEALFSTSASSFPSSFSPFSKGENSIYERFLFDHVRSNVHDVNLVYSDYGSTRVEKAGGGGGVPTPRIDYPLFNDWKFVRKKHPGSDDPTKAQREVLYTKAAKEVVGASYWNDGLKLWGTRLIETTAKGDKYGIYNPNQSTAARINIHLYLQLHYDLRGSGESFDTDEDWDED